MGQLRDEAEMSQADMTAIRGRQAVPLQVVGLALPSTAGSLRLLVRIGAKGDLCMSGVKEYSNV